MVIFFLPDVPLKFPIHFQTRFHLHPVNVSGPLCFLYSFFKIIFGLFIPELLGKQLDLSMSMPPPCCVYMPLLYRYLNNFPAHLCLSIPLSLSSQPLPQRTSIPYFLAHPPFSVFHELLMLVCQLLRRFISKPFPAQESMQSTVYACVVPTVCSTLSVGTSEWQFPCSLPMASKSWLLVCGLAALISAFYILKIGYVDGASPSRSLFDQEIP